MVGPTNRDELVEALVEGGRQREGVAFAKLCKRLGINENEPELLKWVRIGMALVKEQKEFTGMPQARGRPKQQPLESIDVKRAREIELHQYYVKKIFGKRPSIELIISIAQTEFISSLFPKQVEAASLRNSVIRGRSAIKKAGALYQSKNVTRKKT